MCGIGSITLASSVKPEDINLEAGVDALLKELDGRGKDACGLMAFTNEGKTHVEKAACRAADFSAGRLGLPLGTTAVAVHTRFATKGKAYFMKNNHPVQAGSALVIHNGVVDDDWVKGSKGQPTVDTYAIALAMLTVGKPTDGESALDYAKRIVKRVAEEDGGMALQLAFSGSAFLISTKLHGNPLHWAEAEGVRITASTRAAVEDCADAMELELPAELKSYEKRGKKGRVEKHETWVEQIHECELGEMLVWTAGVHEESKLDIKPRVKPVKAWQTSGYGNTGYYERGVTTNKPKPSTGSGVTCSVAVAQPSATDAGKTYEQLAKALADQDDSWMSSAVSTGGICDLCAQYDVSTRITDEGEKMCASCERIWVWEQ